MALISSIYPYVLPDLPNIPTPNVDRATLNVVREFCRRTDILRDNEYFDIFENDPDFNINVLDGYEVLDIKGVTFNGDIVPEYTEDSGIINISDDKKGETIVYYSWGGGNIFTVHPIPISASSNKLKVSYSYQPDRNNREIPDVVFDRWAECLSMKIKSDLMFNAGVAWSNINLAMYNKSEWYRMLSDAKLESNKTYGNPVSAAVYSLDQG